MTRPDIRQPMAGAQSLRQAIVVGAAALALAGCGAATPSSPAVSSPAVAVELPSGPPVLGIDWGRAASVERPENYQVASDAPAYVGTHPILRVPGQAMMSDVTRLPGGRLVAVGYLPPDWTPAAWTSADTATWSLHSMGPTGFTFPVAVAAGA